MHPTAQDHTSGRVQTGDTASVLAEVDTQNRDLHRSAPLSSSCPGQRSRAGEGAGHTFHQLRDTTVEQNGTHCRAMPSGWTIYAPAM
jgi:hypothetical protein